MKKLCDSIVNFHYYSTDENRFVIKPQLWDNTGERERIYLSIYKAFKSNWFWRYKKHGWLYTKFGEMERKWMIKEQEPVSFPGTQQTLINARPGSRTSRSRSRTRTSSWSRAGTSSRCPSFPAEQRPRPGFNRGWRPVNRVRHLTRPSAGQSTWQSLFKKTRRFTYCDGYFVLFQSILEALHFLKCRVLLSNVSSD